MIYKDKSLGVGRNARTPLAATCSFKRPSEVIRGGQGDVIIEILCTYTRYCAQKNTWQAFCFSGKLEKSRVVERSRERQAFPFAAAILCVSQALPDMELQSCCRSCGSETAQHRRV